MQQQESNQSLTAVISPPSNTFNFVRLTAASLVIVGHAYPLLGHSGVPIFLYTPISSYAVKMFFAVSGFLIVASWSHDPHAVRFLIKRVLRISPALILVVVLSACVLGPFVTRLPVADYFNDPIFVGYFQNILLHITYSLPGVFETNTYPNAVNGSLWSLPAEFFMYLLMLAAGMLARFFRLAFEVVWVGLTLAFLALNIIELHFQANWFTGKVVHATLVQSVIEVAPYFMVGGCIQLARRWLPLSPVMAVAALALAVGIATTGIDAEPMFILITSYAVISLGSASFPVVRDFGHFGDLSYGIYLYGFPVAQTLSWGFGDRLPFVGHIMLALVISLLCAFASWHLVEKRALKIKPKAGRSRWQQIISHSTEKSCMKARH